MFQDILDKIINDADKMLIDITKNNSDIDDILLSDLYDFNNVTFDKIDFIKKNHIENMNVFLNYHSFVSIFDINDTSFEQLNDILDDNNLQLFKIKKLMKKDIQDYLINSEKDIINEINNTLKDLNMNDKIQFYFETFKKDNVKEYFIMIENKNNSTELELENDDDIIDNKNDDFDIVFNSKLQNMNDKIEYKKIDISNMLWNPNVLLYKFLNKNTYEYVYIYFDLFKRKDKTESQKIIKLKSNIYCINERYKNLDSIDFTNLENSINKIIIKLSDNL